MVSEQGFPIETAAPSYFKKNKFIQWFSNKIAPKEVGSSSTRAAYLSFLESVLIQIWGEKDGKVNRDGTIMSLLDSLKNSFTGKVHMPHSHMIEYGIHALTFEAIYNKQVAQAKAGGADNTDSLRVARMMGAIERLLRVHDQVDEQLHAGYFFFILMGKTRFVSNTYYCYPMAFILLSYFIPAILEYIDHSETL